MFCPRYCYFLGLIGLVWLSMKLEVDAREAYASYPNLVVLVISVSGEGVANVMTCCWAVQFG